MMWRKSWLECRARIWLTGVVSVLFGITPLAGGFLPKAQMTWENYTGLVAFLLVPVITLLAAGSGINSQTFGGTVRGFHPSMYFLLSMPVSRRRALLIRATIGGLFSLMFLLVALAPGFIQRGGGAPATHVLGSIVFMSLATFALFGLNTFLTTLFDEFWAACISSGITGAFVGAIFALREVGKFSRPLDFVSGAEFNRTGEVHWLAVGIFLMVGVGFLVASVYAVERKEY